jgi:hypothetical protein
MFDSPIDRHRRTKKSLLPFWLLIVTILIVFGYCLYATVGPNPPIIVSKATTHLTAPLGKDGLPDCAAVLLADAMKGVTPETNAAVPLLEAMDIKEFDKLDPSEKDNLKLVFDEIGAEWPPDETLAIPSPFSKEVRIGAVRLYRERVQRPADIEIVNIGGGNKTEGDESAEVSWGDDCCGISDEEFWRLSDEEVANDERAQFYYDSMLDRPWSRNDLPFLADWFDENASAIDHLVAGLERAGWGLPKAAWVRGESDPSTWLDVATMSTARQSARILVTRTHFRIGQQDWRGARSDALAISKLAAHYATGPFLLDQLTSTAFDGMGLPAIQQLALAPDTPAEELRALLSEFDSIGPASRMADVMDRGERYYGLSEVIAWANSSDIDGRLKGYLDYIGFMGSSNPASLNLQVLGRFSIDWNVVLRLLDATYDQVVAAAKIPNGRDRRAALALIDAEIHAAAERVQSTASGFERIWTSAARGELAADVFVSISAMQYVTYFAIEDRNRIDRALTRTAIALAIHRAEHGGYPESLDDLVPDVLATSPVDPVYGGPLGYRRTDDGFLVYSIGFNGVDDGGSSDGEAVGFGRQVFEGIFVNEQSDPAEAADLATKIPKGADDLSLRAPLPIKPWPWEKPPGDGSSAASVESSPGD